MQTELESKQKEHAKLHAKLASCQAELASVQRGLHAKEEQMSSRRSREQASEKAPCCATSRSQHLTQELELAQQAQQQQLEQQREEIAGLSKRVTQAEAEKKELEQEFEKLKAVHEEQVTAMQSKSTACPPF